MNKQLSFLAKPSKQHGGSLAIGKRRSLRPLSPKLSLHITLKSSSAIGGRCLFRHKKMILAVMKKASRLFQVKVYNYAICGNHLHLLIKGKDRESLQNFFRVFAGHTAQNILKLCPLPKSSGGASTQAKGCKKNQRKFWSYLLYSRIVSWGREFKTVVKYIDQNLLETFHIAAYQPRKQLRGVNSS